MNPESVLVEAERIYRSFDPPVIAEAALIQDGRFTAVGSRAEMDRLAPVGTKRTSLRGATMIPGLVESHVHTVFTGMIGQWADLRPEKIHDIAELCQAVEDFGPVSGWFRGWGYDDTMLTDQRHPDRHDLDRISTSHPILVTHISGHFAAANTRALEIAGITESTPDPDGGRFIRDAHGMATGLLWEVGAVRAVRDLCPPPTKEDGLRAASHTMQQAIARGITQIHDMGIGSQLADVELELLRELDAAGRMPVRMFGYLRGDLAGGVLQKEPAVFRTRGSGNLVIRGIKMWADGSIQGLSASLVEPYHCCPDSHGDLLLASEQIIERAALFIDAGAQIAVHANGDNAIAQVVEAYRHLPKTLTTDRRSPIGHRIEHFQMAQPGHISACAEHDIAVSVFVNHVHYWGDRHRDRFIGQQRAARMDPLRECLDAGVRTGIHSDSPITPMDVLATLDTAVTRRTREGHVLGAAQSVTRAEALRLATETSAAVVGAAHDVGTIHPGKLADVTVLDADPLAGSWPGTATPPSDSGADWPAPFADLSVIGTMVGGRWVHGA